MSGGVDSAVAALLLKEAGHDVVGVTLCLGHDEGPGGRAICCGADAVRDARAVCDRIGVAHHVFDFSAAFRERVIGRFVAGHGAGRTPNPCVDCNRFVKFGLLLDKALALGFDMLATGHYAGIEARGGRRCLTRARDAAKDQSYFLYAVPRERLGRVLFPLADLTKGVVREIAARAGLPVARKPESQDLCFGRGTAQGGLGTNGEAPGPIVDRAERVLGRHAGLGAYTVGQRAGLAAGTGRRLYVLAKDAPANRLVVGEREELRAWSCRAGDVNLFVDELPARLSARVRHRGRELPCSARLINQVLEVRFEEPAEALAPGQALVLYDGTSVAGGGTILDGAGAAPDQKE